MSLSVKFNGFELNKYIDVLVGFTPFAGPDWSPELLGDTGLRRGADFSYTTYKQKQIPMPYTVLESLSEKHDDLVRILNVDEPKELIFGNIPDRVFYAIPTGDLDFDDYECFGEGTITWLIPDGLAHSAVEKTFPASLNEDGVLEAIIINEGTEAVPISYDIKMNSENGFIGIISEHGVMQYGYADEADTEERQRSETLISHTGQTDFAAKMLADSRVTLNDQSWSGLTDGMPKWNGAIGKLNYKNEHGSKTWNCLGMTGQGSSAGLKNGQWHGANMTFALPTKSDGTYPSNFQVDTFTWMTCARASQRGGAMLAVIDEDNKILASMWWWDGSTTAFNGSLRCDIQNHGRVFYIENFGSDIDGGAGIRTRVNGNGLVRIRKAGAKFTFNFCGTERSFSYSELKDKKISKVALGFTQVKPTTDLITRLYFLNSFKVIANNVNYIYDIPNRYQPDDVMTIDGSSGKVYKNGVLDLEDEIIGTSYFKAEPGVTRVQFVNSDWASGISATARIREAYL